MDIETQIKEELKQRRLTQLKQRYFSLELDLVALEAVGDIKGKEMTIERMANVQRAYEAVEAIIIE